MQDDHRCILHIITLTRDVMIFNFFFFDFPLNVKIRTYGARRRIGQQPPLSKPHTLDDDIQPTYTLHPSCHKRYFANRSVEWRKTKGNAWFSRLEFHPLFSTFRSDSDVDEHRRHTSFVSGHSDPYTGVLNARCYACVFVCSTRVLNYDDLFLSPSFRPPRVKRV